ncbi:hypothetical protein ACEQPO_10890 [Bacillus sp. SL00103]
MYIHEGWQEGYKVLF